MAELSGGRARRAAVAGVDVSIYVDSSALAKLYVPEPESEALDAFLQGRKGLMISELAITEVLSAVARRRRERQLRARDAVKIRDAVLADAASGAFTRLELSPAVHREAERLLLTTDSLSLRTLDALHIALAFAGGASQLLTFDRRMQEAGALAGLRVIEL